MDYHKLDLGKATSLITSIDVVNLGNKIVFSCLYDPTEEGKPYKIVFDGCREIQWKIFDLEQAQEVKADFIGISLGKRLHITPAVITTDIFEITVRYNEYMILKDW